MTTPSKDSQQFSAIASGVNIPGTSNMVISLMTGPLLVALAGARACSDALIQIGLASEEVFRGERLPNLQNVSGRSDHIDETDIE